MTTKEAVKTMVLALEDKKAEDVQVLQVENLTTLADYFVLCSGNSAPQLRALAENVEKKMKEEYGVLPHHTEGYPANSWILLDYGFALVHIFDKETRAFYGLDKLWADAAKVDPATW